MSIETKDIGLKTIDPLFSVRKLAEFFDCKSDDGSPATNTIIEWWHSARIPPPDLKLSRKAIYWKSETIKTFIENGGLC